MQILVPDIEPDRLQQRLVFLQDRAKAHLGALEEKVDVATEMAMSRRACAATLLRDAACVALLLGKMDHARRLLFEAGRQFLELGMPIGAGIVALADADSAAQVLLNYEDVVEGARHQRGPEEARKRADKRRAFRDLASGDPRQLLGILQADWLMARGNPVSVSFADSDAMRRTLDRAGGYPVGVTGLSIANYARLADELARHADVADSERTWIGRGFTALYATRSENIDAARRDTFHWRMLPRPAEIVDLDATILMFLALGTDLAPKLLEDAQERDISIVDAPLYIAQSLRGDYDFAPHL